LPEFGECTKSLTFVTVHPDEICPAFTPRSVSI
jgi:hypothetical protein